MTAARCQPSDRGNVLRRAASEEAPHEEYDDGADDRADEAGVLAGLVEMDRLSEIGGDERSDDAEHGRQDEAAGVAWAGRQKARQKPDDEADDDRADDVHAPPLLAR